MPMHFEIAWAFKTTTNQKILYTFCFSNNSLIVPNLNYNQVFISSSKVKTTS